jgi:hypothetical protein
MLVIPPSPEYAGDIIMGCSATISLWESSRNQQVHFSRAWCNIIQLSLNLNQYFFFQLKNKENQKNSFPIRVIPCWNVHRGGGRYYIVNTNIEKLTICRG